MTASYPDLRGKHILVTGGANGIGAAVSEAFAAQQARVSILDRDAEAAAVLCRRIRETGGTAHHATADLADAGACDAAVDSAVAALGEVDVLVNNAGFDPRHDITTMTAPQWDELFHLNTTTLRPTPNQPRIARMALIKPRIGCQVTNRK